MPRLLSLCANMFDQVAVALLLLAGITFVYAVEWKTAPIARRVILVVAFLPWRPLNGRSLLTLCYEREGLWGSPARQRSIASLKSRPHRKDRTGSCPVLGRPRFFRIT
jgi:hypothetical protein